MPTDLVMHEAPQALAVMAEALLQAGLLAETDWTGELTASITGGLNRWLAELGLAQSRFFSLGLVFTDDVVADEAASYHDLESTSWLEQNQGAEEEPVGAFGFAYIGPQNIPKVCLGYHISRLEQDYPGAGLSVLAVIERALHYTVSAYTPGRAHCELVEWGWDMDDMDEGDLDVLTVDRYLETVPAAVALCRPNKKALELAALAAPKGSFAQSVFSQTLALLAVEAEDETSAFSSYHNDCQQIPPLVLVWLPENDPTLRCCDDYLNLIQQGEYTDYCWLAGLQISRPETVRKAAEKLRRTGEALGRVESLLRLLDSRQAPLSLKPKRRRKRARPLIELILGVDHALGSDRADEQAASGATGENPLSV